MQHLPKSASIRQMRGAGPIQALVLQVVLLVSVVGGVLLAGAFVHQRDLVGAAMGKREAQQTAAMIYEHLYSVMRKGWDRSEMDDIVHTIGARLPNYKVEVVRGEAVARQFGELAGDAQRRITDPLVAQVIASREDVFRGDATSQRYGFAVKMQSECRRCHTQSDVGEINGVILVSIPTHYLHQPLEDAIAPLALMIGVGALVLVAAIFAAIRARVVAPVLAFSGQVGARDEALRSGNASFEAIVPAASWPSEVVHLAHSYNTLMQRVEHDQRLLSHHSLHDALTGLANRRRFDEVLNRCFAEAAVGQCAPRFGVMLLDLDGFKPVNDTYGHGAGDAVLVAVAEALTAAVRPSDLCARVGGDEFALVIIDASVDEMCALAARLQLAVGELQVRYGRIVLGAACSIGVAAYTPFIPSPTALLEAADASMYQDKTRRKAQR